ncbi:MAG: TetR/AcrR family transcriptional regulator [Candidatus Thiodiazotropha sp. (ex Lucinoma borealis)]|nr:TetR/AcrR family transcriptional regulator [Candidatus Thiodiazotropha sp. (ex Lucinoma borealis)]MCU7857739.1 TetR/AcrR family transcriptional regulator [Candidatus Thiodiazotropha sp. (ex Lucinoma borealis)]MCU7864814.1 TetR/AcrR family transcriptional regulator [Candidatus Thiodiazotropha sp. (ex Lucinoma borealis)]MCU7868915.1 TetR/AcrR family transcriptional regulator [Candidatus Thiodiazotropha sp. (ex Lucinoma borealis)]
MKYDPAHKLATHIKILEAIHRGFRRQGFEGAGIDGLAKDAGVTSGAFYKHFNSKADAFRESVSLGVVEFRAAVEHFQKEHGDAWLDEFAKFYLGEKRCSELGDSCGLQSLTPEVARSDLTTRSIFQSELLKAAKSFSAGLPLMAEPQGTNRAWATIALLIGGVTLARAVEDPLLADEIADAVHNAVKPDAS